MGRTVPSIRMLLDEIIGELSDFRRALRGDDRAAFDSLMNKAREHKSSSIKLSMYSPNIKELWFTRVLLYWDQIFSIVPVDYDISH